MKRCLVVWLISAFTFLPLAAADDRGRTALHHVALVDDTEALIASLAAGADTEARETKYGATAFLAAGAEASARDSDGKIPLSLPLMNLP